MFSQSIKEKEAHASKNNFRKLSADRDFFFEIKRRQRFFLKIKRRQRNLGGCFHSIDQVCMIELQLNSVM